MSPSPSLADLQRWMRWALTHPLGVVGATGGERLVGLPERFEAPVSEALAAVASDSLPGRTAVDRLAVYGGGYFSRLHGTLQLEFPRLAAALGEAPFRALAASHLLRSPSSSPSLADLGEGLADTLRAEPAGREVPWLVDLARVERAAAEIWLSSAEPAAEWTLAMGDDWEPVRLALVPTARLARLGWDVNDWAPEEGNPPRRDGWSVLWRVEASTAAEWIDHRPGAVLEALASGTPLGAACDLAASLGMSTDEVAQAFGHWTGRGWLLQRRGI
jgi:Putative DNA-binding domain